ncbi:MAG: hypothetical protein WAU90_11830 [Methyloceanibacter sp.]
MTACTEASALQLIAAACTFLLAVVWLEIMWVRAGDDRLEGDIAALLRRRSWLNAFVAFGAAAAAVLLLLWVAGCANGAV